MKPPRAPPRTPLTRPPPPAGLGPSFLASLRGQVRVLVANAGMELTSLKRVRVGGFRLPKDLGFGGYK